MGAFGTRSARVARVETVSHGLVRDGSGPTVIGLDPAVIMEGLRREWNRVALTHDSCCICVVSPDGDNASLAIDEFGRRFALKLRSYDAIYRFAADKYLVMLPHIGKEDAVGVIKRLRRQVVGDPFRMEDGENIMVTASFGGTMLDSEAPLHEHIDRASEAHDWALKGMGDSICLWTPKL